MYQFEKIKLVIWDLDETFWEGTFAEGGASIPEGNKALVKRLTDIGIVNSICSKNDWEPTKAELERQGMLEYFVFPSVNWEAKGIRVKQLITDMQLRPVNVLFLDDNPSNREEVRYFCPDIMVEGPEIIPQLIQEANALDKSDMEHKRLKQYRVLEEKRQGQLNYSSNEEFLTESNIRLEIKHDCLNQLERIHDLIMRSNQLNFTKLRSSQDELKELLCDKSVEAGYVTVKDRFGDYGIVGFYAVKDNSLIHFTFSCRTLGMGIEQYTYNYLHRPDLEIIGEVISDLSMTEFPKWINQEKSDSQADKMEIRNLKKHMVLVKGPCDLFQVYPYIANTEMFDTEFSHTTDKGIYIESTSHTTHMVEAARLTAEQKQMVVDEVPFVDADIYSDKMFNVSYKVVFVSILTDPNLGVYRRKETGERLAFVEYTQPVTDSSNWDRLISGELLTNNFRFTREILEAFAKKYEFIGRNTPEQIVDNLTYIREKLDQSCVLAVMLGGELCYQKNTMEAYKDRHIVHKQINDAIRQWAEGKNNVRLLDVNKYLVDQSSFYDHFNHYIKPVYYKLAEEMVQIVNECTGSHIKETSKLKMIQVRAKEALAPSYYKLRKMIGK